MVKKLPGNSRGLAGYTRLMCRGDIAQVTEIDREAFPNMYPPANYERELKNQLAHYIVACDGMGEARADSGSEASANGAHGLAAKIKRFFNHDRSFYHELHESENDYITGFSGFWIMAGEAHIISIAVRESSRRHGIGELLLISVIDLAMELNARVITLEARVSNVTAQSLYLKYGFTRVGHRRRYYIDDGEDAVIMSTEDITLPSFRADLQRLKQDHSKRWGIALYQTAW